MMADNCECMIDVDTGEAEYMVKIISIRDRVARKQHRCVECNRAIEPGEKYRVETGGGGAKIETYKTCLECMEIRKTFFCAWIYGCVLEDLRIEIQENNGEFKYECFQQLSLKARKKFLEIVREIREDLGE